MLQAGAFSSTLFQWYSRNFTIAGSQKHNKVPLCPPHTSGNRGSNFQAIIYFFAGFSQQKTGMSSKEDKACTMQYLRDVGGDQDTVFPQYNDT